jgi:hypothetical protein
LLAEAIADLHHVMAIVVENAPELIPGEAVDELRNAWADAEPRFAALVESLIPQPPFPERIRYDQLVEAQLTRAVGRAKRAFLKRGFDGFMRHWNSAPRTRRKQLRATEAAADYLEFGESVVGSIPGHEYVVEALALTRQLLGVRARRGS